MDYVVGVDIGGTFTDCVVVDDDYFDGFSRRLCHSRSLSDQWNLHAEPGARFDELEAQIAAVAAHHRA